jgi:hypothetical protein
MTNDPRILELLDWEAATGSPLPRPAAQILALEDAGHVVNLATGDILWNEADKPQHWELTVIGEATGVVLALEDAGTVHP